MLIPRKGLIRLIELESRAMGYPFAREIAVATVVLPNTADGLLRRLQACANTLKHRQLLTLVWPPTIDSDPIADVVAAFHAWLPRNTPDDQGYVLHVGLDDEQQGHLHRHLVGYDAMATVWQEAQQQLLLIGDFRQPLHRQIIDLVSATPDLSAEEIGRRLAREHGHNERYVRNEVTVLAQQRVVARQKRLPRLPALGVPRTTLKRNVFHYWPLWQPDAAPMPTSNTDCIDDG